MKRLLLLITLSTLALASIKGYDYWRKFNHSNRLKVGVGSFSFPKLNLRSLLGDITLAIDITLDNYSSSTFSLEQISIEIYDKLGRLVAEQIAPLTTPFTIKPNKTNLLPLTLEISSHSIAKLIAQHGGTASVGASYLSSGSYGIPLKIKGFAIAEGFRIDIDQQIEI